MKNNLMAVIMAAGKGTRMADPNKPKVLFPINGKPMLEYVLDTLSKVGVASPVIVVGYMAEKVMSTIGPGHRYATQVEQNGTATAVLAAKDQLADQDGITLIVSGDQPFIRAESIESLVNIVDSHDATIAMLVGEFAGSEFDAFGRVMVDEEGLARQIVEAKNATEEQLKIRLFNLATYAVDNKWLWQALGQIKKNELTGEYYLTDLIALANEQGKKVAVVKTSDEGEAIGINTLEHLALAEKRLSKS